MNARFTIVGLGEALFDVFPDAQILGGAPLNAAVHAHQLAQPRGGRGVVVSRIGQDDLGAQVVSELRNRGMEPGFLQHDPDHGTGVVYVGVDASGEPSYDIVGDVAYDWLQWDGDLDDIAARCEAVTFGSLCQRQAQSRNTIYRFLQTARRAVKMFDVNLRQDFYNAGILRRSCELADVVKLNEHELPLVADLLATGGDDDVTRARNLIRKFELRMIVFTRGAEGTTLITADNEVRGEPVSYDRANDADSVGAGDACGAGVLVGLVLRMPLAKVVELANHAGAYVASQPGATPELPDAVLDKLNL